MVDNVNVTEYYEHKHRETFEDMSIIQSYFWHMLF